MARDSICGLPVGQFTGLGHKPALLAPFVRQFLISCWGPKKFRNFFELLRNSLPASLLYFDLKDESGIKVDPFFLRTLFFFRNNQLHRWWLEWLKSADSRIYERRALKSIFLESSIPLSSSCSILINGCHHLSRETFWICWILGTGCAQTSLVVYMSTF